MNKLLFGTAGIPITAPLRTTTEGIRYVRQLGLGCMELEFVYNVNISEDKAPLIKKIAADNKVSLTCHGQYFINLNSLDKAKIDASAERILNAARIAHLCGAQSLVFHPAYYMKMEKEKVYENVKRELKDIVSILKNEGNSILIRPETTGKKTQFGSVRELLRLSQELENVMPCIDFAHVHARSNGKYNSYEKFSEILADYEGFLGKEALKNMHIHVSGIVYSDKGERNHIILEESDFNYKDLLQALKFFKAGGILISESPNIEDDALLMKRWYDEAQDAEK